MRRFSLTLPILLAAACNQPPEGHGITLEPAEPSTIDELVVTVTPEAVDPNGNDVVEYNYRWTMDGSPFTAEGNTIGAGNTRKGQTWAVSVTPFDGKLSGTPQEASVVILNSLPTATVSLNPEDPDTTDDIRSNITTHDIDNDPVKARYQWKLNDSVTSLTSDTLRANRTNKGEVWELSVFPHDGEAEGEPAVATITIVNTPPEVVSAEVRSATTPMTAASTLTCYGRGWSDVDEDEEGYTTRWFVNGKEVATTSELAGQFVRGDQVSCELTPFDGEESGSPVVSKEVLIRNSPPSVGSVVIGPEEPIRKDTVTATISGAEDLDGDEVSYKYSWRVNTREVASSDDLVSSRFKRDDKITLVLTPTDGIDDGPTITSNEVVGGNNIPVITKLTVDPSPLYTDSLAEAVAVVDDFDSDDVSLVMEWYINGSRITATTPTIEGKTWFERGDTLYITASPDDGADTGAKVTSATYTVANSPPTEPGLVLDPAKPEEGVDIQCKIDKASTDADGDDITYTFEWEVAGKTVTGFKTTYANDTLDGDDWSKTDLVTCYVTPNDGRDDGPTASEQTSSLYVGMTGSYGKISGADWKVCRVATGDAWVAANTAGYYNADSMCKNYGYTKGAIDWGGTCGTVCGYCKTPGREYYDKAGGSGTRLGSTVHWKCGK